MKRLTTIIKNNNINYMDNSLFFFVDSVVGEREKFFLNVSKFFNDIDLLSSTKYFLILSNSKIDFNFLEKNNRLVFFFFFINKLFFKDQIKNLKFLLDVEKNNILSNVMSLNIKFYLNFFFLSRHILSFVFLLKHISNSKKRSIIY